MAAENGASHWNRHAARWRLIGPPLRPCLEDIRYLRDSVGRLLADGAAPNREGAERERTGLLLGVTPEIAEVVWEPPLRLVAVDKSEGMVRAVWPGDTPIRRAQVGDWLALDLPEAPFDVALGDGVFSIFDYPSGYVRLAEALARLLRPGGVLTLRLFCRPEPAEQPEAVFQQLFAGNIGNFHVFKWRLAMALQGDATRGVRLADIWGRFAEHAKSAAHVASHTGWPEPVVATIEGYRDVQDHYSFSTEREVIDALSPSFELVETWRPSYELGERCPQLSFRRRR